MDPEQFIDRFLRIESREIIDMTLKVSMRSVVDGFKNLDDLRTIIHRYGEFRSGVEVGLTLPEPRIEQVRVPLGPEQEDLYGELVRKARAHAPAVADQGQQPEQDPRPARAPLARRLARKARRRAWNTTRRSPPSPPPITPRPS
jgi:hypothetical protein